MRVSLRERRLDRGGIQNTPPNLNISKSQILLPPAKLGGGMFIRMCTSCVICGQNDWEDNVC